MIRLKNILLFSSLLAAALAPTRLPAATEYAGITSGYIFLQVEKQGQAWYVYPGDQRRYYLGRPDDAFQAMKLLSLGAKHDFIANTEIFPARLSGRILRDTESKGEAYYIYPRDLKKYYLGRPADAFRIMRELGRGISDADLTKLPLGDIQAGASLPKDATAGETILLSVPFSAQAPFGNWSDQRLEDGCEEASALMAVKWARGESLSRQEANDEILAASDYILDKYGEYRDISSTDTVAWIFKDYFNYDKISLVKGVSADDIIAELKKGNLVVAAMDGQLLDNPYFTPPGPEHHMLVIRGYDEGAREFTTNDPGTRHGEAYRYDADLLFGAIGDYPTGHHEPVKQIEKNIIVIRR